MATTPGGFKISPYLQEHLCRAGTKMTFEEANEEVVQLLGLETNEKQIERLCHHYGESLGQIDWCQAHNDAIQLRLPLKEEVTYAMMDGSMILTREKNESWKEVKLLRMFQYGHRSKQWVESCIDLLMGNCLFQPRSIPVVQSKSIPF